MCKIIIYCKYVFNYNSLFLPSKNWLGSTNAINHSYSSGLYLSKQKQDPSQCLTLWPFLHPISEERTSDSPLLCWCMLHSGDKPAESLSEGVWVSCSCQAS